MITREAVRLFRNTNAFLMEIDRQYTSEFAITGAKIGNHLRIRLPNDFVAVTGPDVTGQVQSTSEQQTPLVIADFESIPVEFSSVDYTLSLDDFSERIVKPMVNALAGRVASKVMSVADSIPNLVFNTDGSGGIAAPTRQTILQAKAVLTNNSCPEVDRKIVLSPTATATMVDTLAPLFNPANQLGTQYMQGSIMGKTLGFTFMEDQTVKVHTNGTYTAGNVNGAGQSGSTITVNAITGTFNKGDIITFANTTGVNRVTHEDTGVIKQFVVTADVPSGSTSIPIYPAMIPSNAGSQVAYQTVQSSPANNATITLVGGAGTQYVKNLAFTRDAFTLVTADLSTQKSGAKVAREVFDSISLRLLSQNQPLTDQELTRLDVLFGYAPVRPEWACIIATPVV